MATTIQNIELPKLARARDTSSGLQTVGSELITNGDFASDTAWSKSNGTISGGKGVLDGTSAVAMLWQDILTVGKTYRVTFDVENHNGDTTESRVMDNSGSELYPIVENGTGLTFDFTHTQASGNLLFRARNGSSYKIDNVSVLEIQNFSNNNHGQIYSGRALEFDGVGDYLSQGGSDITLVDFSAETTQANRAWTVACWVNIDSASTGHIQNVIGTGSGISTSYLGIDTNEKLTIYDQSGGAYRVGNTALNINTWYRALWVFNGVDEIAFYLNGVADGTGAMGTSGDDADLTLRYIGARAAGNATASASRYFTGKMADLQLWQGAFTQADVTYDYLNPEQTAISGGGTALTESNLKLWYPMQDGHRGQQSYILDGANTGAVVELVTNGDFATDSNWTFGGSYSVLGSGIVGNKAVVTSSGGNGYVRQHISGTAGDLVKVSFKYSDKLSSGLAYVRIDGTDIKPAGSWQEGTITVYYKLVSSGNLYLQFMTFATEGASFTLEDVSVKQVNDKHHATTLFHGDELWDIADNNVSDWVATAATSVASSEVAIGGTTDGVKLIYGSQNSGHGSYAQFKASKFLSEDLTVGRNYTVSGLFATDVVGNTNAPGVAVYAGGFNYPTGFATAAANIIPATNLITNGTMEVDDNWVTYNNANVNERSSTQAHNGTYSRKFTTDSSSEGIKSDSFTTVTGTTYLVSYWVYPDDGTIVRAAILEGDGSGFTKDVSTTGLTENAWNKVEFQYTETAGGSGAVIVIHSNSQTSGDFYIDDVVVTAFLEREITFTAATTTGDYLAARNVDQSATNNIISATGDSALTSNVGNWIVNDASGSNAAVSHDTADGGSITINPTTDDEVEGMLLTRSNMTALEIGRTYTVLVNMKAASGTPDVEVRLGNSASVTQAITATATDYNFSVTPAVITGALRIQTDSTDNINIIVYSVEVYPNCNLYVDDLSFKEIGVASGWTDADEQLYIPQTALQSYNELAWFDGTSASDGNVTLDSQIATTDNDWSLSFWVSQSATGADYEFVFGGTGSSYRRNIVLKEGSDRKLKYRDSGGTYRQLSDADIPQYEWVHIVITATADTSMLAYVNGVAQTTNSDMSDTELLVDDFMGWAIDDSFPTLGSINEISYYNDILTAAEVLDLFNDGKAKSALEASGSAGLVNYWRNNGLSEWKDLKGSNDGNTSAGVTETILIPQGIDSSRDSQGFIMNKQKDTSSLNLDGIGYVSLPTTSVVTDDFSFEAWAKAEHGITHESVIMEVGASMLLFGNNHGYIRAVDGTFTNQLPTHSFVLGNWYHIVVTRIRNGNQIMYVDGVAKNTVTAPNTAMTLSDTTIGKDNTTRVSRDALDGVHLYSKALSAAEVLRNYKATKGSHRN